MTDPTTIAARWGELRIWGRMVERELLRIMDSVGLQPIGFQNGLTATLAAAALGYALRRQRRPAKYRL